jgi:eukaryotic-like serine/threonine-protein kinase
MAATDETPKRELVGEVIEGRYRLTARLGGGAAGSVYRAEDLSGGAPLAIKIWDLSVLDSQTAGRFHRETKALGTLDHPHIVSIRDYGLLEGMPYLAMELLEGTTLEPLVEAGALPQATALAISAQVLQALAYAHERNVVHRDLKPDNVFLARTAQGALHVKLLDYGLAKFLEPGDDPMAGNALTKRGTLLGTPLYMAPEQALGRAIDARTDVYAAGCVLFEMLTGQPPFMAPSLTELLRAHLVQPVPRIADLRPQLALAEALQSVLDRALAKQAEQRFANAGEMLRALLAVSLPEQSALDEAETGRMASSAQPPPSAPPPPAAPGRPGDPFAQPAFTRSAARPHAGDSLVQPSAPIARTSSNGWVLLVVAATLCAVIGWLLR